MRVSGPPSRSRSLTLARSPHIARPTFTSCFPPTSSPFTTHPPDAILLSAADPSANGNVLFRGQSPKIFKNSALFPPVGFSPSWKCDQLLRVSTNMPAHRLVRHSFNEGGSLGVGGSIARRRLPGRRHRLVRRSFSEGRSLPSSALMPFILVPFVLLVLLVSFLPPPCLPPNPNRTLNLSCLYTLPLRPIHPVAVPGGTLKRFALFASFSTLFPNDCHRPPRPNHCARATCNYAISKPYQFRNAIFRSSQLL